MSEIAEIAPSSPGEGLAPLLRPPRALVSAPSEGLVIFLVGAIQFINVLDFMMVMPLGPDFAQALGIATSKIGLVGGSYTAAAACSGILGAMFLDRYDRRVALGFAMMGLVVGTALGGFAQGLGSMILARVMAGCFGGPATSLSLAVIADTVPPARRGKALGKVMGAFSVASVLGVPLGLELARAFSWRAPFFAVALLGSLLSVAALWFMPPMRSHLASAKRNSTAPLPPLLNRLTLLSLTNTALIMLGVFAVVPNISAFVQHNLGFPRERIGFLYLVGGIASFVAMRIVGSFVDRIGAARMVALGTCIYGVALYTGFIQPLRFLPVLFVFTLLMLSGSVRMVPMQTLASRVPRPQQRARFMSVQSSVQHLASAIGAMGASAFLVTQPSGALVGLDRLAWLALALASVVPFTARRVELWIAKRDAIGNIAQPK